MLDQKIYDNIRRFMIILKMLFYDTSVDTDQYLGYSSHVQCNEFYLNPVCTTIIQYIYEYMYFNFGIVEFHL
jgi:hypothetical protein